MSKSGGDKKVANSLVAVSCAAVLAVYSAGYARTRAAASQFDEQAVERRRPAPEQPRVAEPEVKASRPEPSVRTEAAVAILSEKRVAEVVPGAPEATASAQTVEPPTVEAPPAAPVAAVVAPAPVSAPPPPPPPPAPPAPKWKDGTFTGWGTSRHGDIQAAVVIEDGKIQKAMITECNTRYSCDVIDMLPPQPVVRQSPDVDYVTRATESANAFYYALVEALNKATPSK